MARTLSKIEVNPQPKLPIVSFFHSIDEGYADHDGWCYQCPESDTDAPGLVYNATYFFDDPNQPGRIGDLYNSEVIERVRIRTEGGIAYWLINTKGE